MKNSASGAYAAAGVDITAGYKAVELMKQHIARTLTEGVCGEVGGFGGLYELDITGMKRPVLVSGTDGVGTKLKLAFLMDRHDTVGIDCVAMCVNDIICCGAKPLFFLDYIACGKNVPERIADIVKGVSEGCVQAGCALIGGETAEMPGFYPVDEYDLAGFSVGVVDREKLIDNSSMAPGDVLIALPSSGVHSNGFSLVRRIFALDGEQGRENLSRPCAALGGETLGDALLQPTRIYVRSVLALLGEVSVKGISHITGGGFYENIPRSIPDGLGAFVKKAEVRTGNLFRLIAEEGGVEERDMFNTFNMGVGMCITVSASEADKALSVLRSAGEDAYIIGEVRPSEEKLCLC
ncbi:MAG: phosphoribosylformylglycinamidine cyclo-ligase [Oscillospiraceae bacterium]|nr:phosphoribosylformylglycinamidine cyclo-ligase [Oscillospiraceae bacterium]